jgi:hypothetical protein
MPSSGVGRTVGDIGKKMIDSVLDKIKSEDASALASQAGGTILPSGGKAVGRGQAALIAYGRRLGMSASTYPGHHPSQAKARDFMPVSGGRGNKMAGHAWAHAKQYGIWYVIWNRRIASRTRPGAGWRPYTRYGKNASPSQAHTNHVHVAWYDKGGILEPGWTLAYNGTGRQERVTSPGSGADGGLTINGGVHGYSADEVAEAILKRQRRDRALRPVFAA